MQDQKNQLHFYLLVTKNENEISNIIPLTIAYKRRNSSNLITDVKNLYIKSYKDC